MTGMFKLRSSIRKLAAYGLILALILGIGFTNIIAFADNTVADQDMVFSDIEGHWAAEQILNWSAKDLVAGYADGTFGPERGVTRAEFITFVNRAYGLKEKASAAFVDVSSADWFVDEVAKAVAAEYISGYDDGTMRPNAEISRLEAAVILYRLLRLESYKSESWIEGFNDADTIADWGRVYVNSAVAEGYFSGYPDGTFKPGRVITRAETVSLLSKAVGTLYNVPGVYGPAEHNKRVEGNVTVSVSGVTLKDLTIEGDLFLTAGIGDGDFEADGVVVKGRTIVGGGGHESIVFNNSTLGDVIVYVVDGKVRVVAKGDTSINDVILESGGFLQEENLTGEGFGNVQILVLKPGQEVELDGDFDSVDIETSVEMSVTGNTRIKELNVSEDADGTEINLGRDTVIDTLTLDGGTDVTGKGTIKTVNVNTDDYSFEKGPDKTVVKGEEPEEDKKEEEEEKRDRRPSPSKRAVTGIEAEPTDETLIVKVGPEEPEENRKIAVTVSPSNASNKSVIWESSNPDVASVDANGVVMGVSGGYATITATTVDGGFEAEKHVVVGDILVPAHYANPEAEGTIQGVIAKEANSGDVIAVAPGEYREQLIINKPLTLLGPNAGIAGYRDRNDEAIITYPDNPQNNPGSSGEYAGLLLIEADNVIISGFTLNDGNKSSSSPKTRGINAHGENIKVTDNIVDGFNYVQILITSSFQTEGGEWDRYSEYCKNALVQDNYAKNALDFTSIYLQGASGNVEDNIVENACRAIQIQPYGESKGGKVKKNTLNGFMTGIYYNYAEKGAGKWTIKDNTITVAQVPSDYGSIENKKWAGIEVRTFGTSGTGSAPQVFFEGNSVDGAGASENLTTIGILMTPDIDNEAVATFTKNTFTNVDFGAQRNDGSLDLGQVFKGNIFPDGSAVIGDEIKVLEENKIYNQGSGNDYNTIQAAVGAADGGDTILVGPGEYKENVTINKALTIIGSNSSLGKPVIAGYFNVTANGEQETVIDNLSFKAGSLQPDGNYKDNVLLTAAKNVKIKNCIFDAENEFMTGDGGGVRAIQMKSKCEDIEIDKCTFKDGYYVTIQGYVDNLSVEDSLITNCKSGINVQGGKNLGVKDTDISVVAQAVENNTYCVRFASAGENTGKDMSIEGGTFILQKDSIGEPTKGKYHSAIIVRTGATGNLNITGATIDGEVVDLSKKLGLDEVLNNSGNVFVQDSMIVEFDTVNKIVSVAEEQSRIREKTEDTPANLMSATLITQVPGVTAEIEMGKVTLKVDSSYENFQGFVQSPNVELGAIANYLYHVVGMDVPERAVSARIIKNDDFDSSEIEILETYPFFEQNKMVTYYSVGYKDKTTGENYAFEDSVVWSRNYVFYDQDGNIIKAYFYELHRVLVENGGQDDPE